MFILDMGRNQKDETIGPCGFGAAMLQLCWLNREVRTDRHDPWTPSRLTAALVGMSVLPGVSRYSIIQGGLLLIPSLGTHHLLVCRR